MILPVNVVLYVRYTVNKTKKKKNRNIVVAIAKFCLTVEYKKNRRTYKYHIMFITLPYNVQNCINKLMTIK